MSIQYTLEIIGVFSFAISGALAVREMEHQDWFAATFTAFLTALGGGTIRDVCLGSYPLAWVGDINLVYAILVGVIVTFLFYKVLRELRTTLFLFDTWGNALFTIVGTEKAMNLGVSAEIAVIMGVFTAVMGGVIRDMMTNTIPIIYSKEVYATPCLIGAICFVIMSHYGVERNFSFISASAVIIIIRLLAVRYHWTIPKFFRE